MYLKNSKSVFNQAAGSFVCYIETYFYWVSFGCTAIGGISNSNVGLYPELPRITASGNGLDPSWKAVQIAKFFSTVSLAQSQDNMRLLHKSIG